MGGLLLESLHFSPLSPSLSLPPPLSLSQVHRLIVVDEGHKVIGIVSLSDVLKFLVLIPHETGTDM